MAVHAPPASARPLDIRAVLAWQRRLARDPGFEGVWLHREVAHRLRERLAIIRHQPARWIDAGGTLGASTQLLREAYPHAEGWVIEPDRHWLERSRAAARRPWWSRALRRSGPALLGPDDPWPAAPIELIWSNMTLQRDPDPPATFARWHAALAPGGFLMFSCLGPDSFRELRELYAARAWGPPGAAFVDMHDLGDMLVHAGFADPVMDQERLTLTWADASRLLADLREAGVNAAPERFCGLRTPRWRQRLADAIGSLADASGRIRLTVEVAYGHAFRVERAARSPATGTISVDALRATARERPTKSMPG